MRISLALIAAFALFLPCTSSMADDLEAVILYEPPQFVCLDGSIQFFSNSSTGDIDTVWWDIDNDGTDDFGGSFEETQYKQPLISWNALGGGDYTVKLTVKDYQNPPESDSDTVYPIYVGEPIILAEQRLGTYWVDFNGALSQPLSTVLSHSYAWDLDDDGQLDDSTSATPSWPYSPGPHDVTLGVTYDEGNHTPEWYCENTVTIYVR